MLSRAPERKMVSVRALLLLGWLGLIFSLFWDPLSPELTRPDNLASPFHIKSTGLLVQGVEVTSAAYQMSNRFFWTMILPFFPLFLMIFGHEAWRRICPLSFASQIPRYLGLQRQVATVQRRTGRVKRAVPLLQRGGWLERNSWYFQLGFLYLGLCGRLLFTNADRTLLACAFIAVICASMVVGALWGGKTWCNFFCPANVVQRIYTEPRGIFESAPHFTRPPISQSMCRTTSSGAEISSCVGCTANCGDINLENAYWETIDAPQRRHVYYMFFGLIIGFYGYYYLYSGNWDYYFSGSWTHEDQLSQLLSPGLFIDGTAIPIPKLFAAPLAVAAAMLLALLLGLAGEYAYRWFRRRRKAIVEAEIVNHCLSFSAFVSINAFYAFAGRPNVLLMPPMVGEGVTITVFLVSTLWFWQAIHRTPAKYRRESIASSLLEQLKKMMVDGSRYLDGRSLDELKLDELYILGKVLPAFSHEQRITAYRNILDEAIVTGQTKSRQFLDALGEVRADLGVTSEEHSDVLKMIGSTAEFEPPKAELGLVEKAECLANYSELVGTAIANKLEAGTPLETAIELPDIGATIQILRASLFISDSEHQDMLHSLTAPGGIVLQRLNLHFERLRDLLAVKFCIQTLDTSEAFSAALVDIVSHVLAARQRRLYHKIFALLRVLGGSPAGTYLAAMLTTLLGEEIQVALRTPLGHEADLWLDTLDEVLVSILLGRAGKPEKAAAAPEGVWPVSYRDVIKYGLDHTHCLQILLEEDEPVVRAVALTAFFYLDPKVTRSCVPMVSTADETTGHWMLDEVVQSMTGQGPKDLPAERSNDIRLTVLSAQDAAEVTSWSKPYVTIGRAPGNDIALSHRALAAYHIAIRREAGEIRILRLDSAPIYIDGQPCREESVAIDSGARISFVRAAAEGPVLHLEWDGGEGVDQIQPYDSVTKLVWLYREPLLRMRGLAEVAQLAAGAEARRYPAGAVLCRQGEPARELFFVVAGEIEIVSVTADGQEIRNRRLADVLGDALNGTPDPRYDATLKVVSEFAIVISVLTEMVGMRRRDIAERPRLPAPASAPSPETVELLSLA